MRLATALCLLAFTGVASLATPPRCTLTVPPGADLQNAVDRLPTGRATVCLGAGEFRLDRFLSIHRGGVTIRGEGPTTVLRLRDGLQSPLVVIGDYRTQIPALPVADVALERMRLVGNGDAGAEVQTDHPYLTNSAVVVRAGRRIVLRDLDVSACRSACLLTEHDTDDVLIERAMVTGSTWDGISLNRTSHARLLHNVIRANTAAGITAEHLEDAVIADNVIADNRAHGVYLADSYRNVFDRNRLAFNTNAGIFLTCSVRLRDPGPVACWRDSMSQANRFERNEFVGNRRTFIVAADAAADCRSPGFVANVSRRDRFESAPAVDQRPDVFGRCLELVADGSVQRRPRPRRVGLTSGRRRA
jgi:parallel beta-helix repeat protein